MLHNLFEQHSIKAKIKLEIFNFLPYALHGRARIYRSIQHIINIKMNCLKPNPNNNANTNNKLSHNANMAIAGLNAAEMKNIFH